VIGALTWSDGWELALAFFLVVVGVGFAWALLALAGTLTRLSAFVRGAQDEILPVIHKVGGSVDRVNAQLDKVDQVTDHAVDAVDAIDHTVRTISVVLRRPVEVAAGVATGARYGFATLRSRHDVKAAVARFKEASARRQADLRDELGDHSG
jgi:ABC-type transporter Mla subunit MlaD